MISVKVLYLASNSTPAASLQIEEEINLFRTFLDQNDPNGLIDLRTYPSVEVAELPAIVSRIAPDIVHFAAHGTSEGLSLAHRERGAVNLSGDQLAVIFSAMSVRPKLVVLNACNSHAMAERVATASDFAIGIDAPVTNIGARKMAAILYQQLARGASLAAAFKASATMLEIEEGGNANAKLFPVDGQELARRTMLSEPFRIVACFPDVDAWLDGDQRKKCKVDMSAPYVQFGVAGAPQDSCQLQFFTDDESVQPAKGEGLESARSWLIEDRPVRGEIWLSDWYSYYGDLHWYASVVTGGKSIHSASSAMCDALERYYFIEAWRGDLPPELETQIRKVVAALRQNDGARRGRKPLNKIGVRGKMTPGVGK